MDRPKAELARSASGTPSGLKVSFQRDLSEMRVSGFSEGFSQDLGFIRLDLSRDLYLGGFYENSFLDDLIWPRFRALGVWGFRAWVGLRV